ncbi:lysosome-associated membrane glycoprotein 1-like [Daphnia pulex]|uniref:lysosome-associated membrane glycoprotein 1-like n=1 Tax=Daphnia pulex TaxID=6669 RepID=UPI001EDFE3BD|nr:lysosome-associated membrane glycoprotein 1-like [Daphnia pulex]
MAVKKILAMLCVCICTGNALDVMASNFSDYSEQSNVTTTSTIKPSTSTTTLPTPEMSTTEMSSTEMSTTPSTTPFIPTTTTSPTTFIPVSPTYPPTPKPNPPNPAMNWVVVDEQTNVTCIVVKLAASFVIPYLKVNGQMENVTLALPSNATSSGTCNLDDLEHGQEISLQWYADKSGSPNTLTFAFHRNVSSGTEATGKESVYLSEINLSVYLDSENFVNASRVGNYSHGNLQNSLHSVPVNNSYRCNSEETFELNLIEEIDKVAIIHFAHMQTEAFRTQNDDKFHSAVDCAADKVITSDIVPIAVGCALAALVVVVLVAYLIGRRRARQRGYQSV